MRPDRSGRSGRGGHHYRLPDVDVGGEEVDHGSEVAVLGDLLDLERGWIANGKEIGGASMGGYGGRGEPLSVCAVRNCYLVATGIRIRCGRDRTRHSEQQKRDCGDKKRPSVEQGRFLSLCSEYLPKPTQRIHQ